MSGILVFFHCRSNTGYAIQRHEYTFSQMAFNLTKDWKNVHFAYPDISRGRSLAIPDELTNIVEIDSLSENEEHIRKVQSYIRENKISVAFGFDQPVKKPFYRYFREAGISHLFSYWGAPMSSFNAGVKLFLKKLEVSLYRSQPEYYIFQSNGMRRTAVEGRGIPSARTVVINSGIDTSYFRPDEKDRHYAYVAFDIPKNRKIVYYSGHMEERKGVQVIVKAAEHIVNILGYEDIHFLFFGNEKGQEKRFYSIYENSPAEKHITFGGYRHDLYKILRSVHVGCLATTGWDSFPMSSLEIASSGVPLLVSDLLGIKETVEHERTGYRFPAGDYKKLADYILLLCKNQSLRDQLGRSARRRVEESFTREMQIENLTRFVAEKTKKFPDYP